jgi:hypothetical protein
LTAETGSRRVITIPAPVVAPIRESIYRYLAGLAGEFVELTEHRERATDLAKRQRIRKDAQAACALLDEIGWSRTDLPTAQTVDLPRHRDVLLESVRGALGDVEDALGDVVNGLEENVDRAVASIERAYAVREFTRVIDPEQRTFKHTTRVEAASPTMDGCPSWQLDTTPRSSKQLSSATRRTPSS